MSKKCDRIFCVVSELVRLRIKNSRQKSRPQNRILVELLFDIFDEHPGHLEAVLSHCDYFTLVLPALQMAYVCAHLAIRVCCPFH